MTAMNMVQALNSAMDVMLERDSSVVVLGEDVGYFGGVFRVTDGLQKKFGAHRVLDTPIAEGGIVGAAIGMGVNGLTGDYSRGASGYLIENGEITRPVAEITIAGNLLDMFAKMIAGNDLEFRHASNAPTLRIDGMMVAGS